MAGGSRTGYTVPLLSAVADMDDMRVRAWLLAFDLSAEGEKERILLDLPRYRLN